MPAAAPRIDQAANAVPTGTVNESRDDLDINQVVTLVDTSSAVKREWVMLSKPTGSAATLSASTGASVTFTPDVAGSYRFRLAVDGGAIPEQIRTFVAAVRVALPAWTGSDGIRIPAPEETTEFGSTGWHDAMEETLNTVATYGFGVTVQNNAAPVGARHNAINFVNATSVVDAGGGVATVTLPVVGGGGGGASVTLVAGESIIAGQPVALRNDGTGNWRLFGITGAYGATGDAQNQDRYPLHFGTMVAASTNTVGTTELLFDALYLSLNRVLVVYRNGANVYGRIYTIDNATRALTLVSGETTLYTSAGTAEYVSLLRVNGRACILVSETSPSQTFIAEIPDPLGTVLNATQLTANRMSAVGRWAWAEAGGSQTMIVGRHQGSNFGFARIVSYNGTVFSFGTELTNLIENDFSGATLKKLSAQRFAMCYLNGTLNYKTTELWVSSGTTITSGSFTNAGSDTASVLITSSNDLLAFVGNKIVGPMQRYLQLTGHIPLAHMQGRVVAGDIWSLDKWEGSKHISWPINDRTFITTCAGAGGVMSAAIGYVVNDSPHISYLQALPNSYTGHAATDRSSVVVASDSIVFIVFKRSTDNLLYAVAAFRDDREQYIGIAQEAGNVGASILVSPVGSIYAADPMTYSAGAMYYLQPANGSMTTDFTDWPCGYALDDANLLVLSRWTQG